MKPELAWRAFRIALLLRFALHALFVPAFEGPDEPFHLARIRLFLHGPASQAIQGTPVDAEVTAAIGAWPCGPDLARAFGCPPFGSEPAAFTAAATIVVVSGATWFAVALRVYGW